MKTSLSVVHCSIVIRKKKTFSSPHCRIPCEEFASGHLNKLGLPKLYFRTVNDVFGHRLVGHACGCSSTVSQRRKQKHVLAENITLDVREIEMNDPEESVTQHNNEPKNTSNCTMDKLKQCKHGPHSPSTKAVENPVRVKFPGISGSHLFWRSIFILLTATVRELSAYITTSDRFIDRFYRWHIEWMKADGFVKSDKIC